MWQEHDLAEDSFCQLEGELSMQSTPTLMLILH